MTEDEVTIAAGHECRVGEPGYYWARLVVWVPPLHLPQKRKWPMVCDPSVVELRYTATGVPRIHANLGRRESLTDWLFLQRIPDIAGVPARELPSSVDAERMAILVAGPARWANERKKIA